MAGRKAAFSPPEALVERGGRWEVEEEEAKGVNVIGGRSSESLLSSL